MPGGAAWVVHDAPFMHAVPCAHGVQVPNSTGLLGGYPGSTHVFTLVRESDPKARLATGRPVLGAGDVTGNRQPLDAKPGEIVFTPADVFDWSWQGGGGYGDPLDADPADVAADVTEATSAASPPAKPTA